MACRTQYAEMNTLVLPVAVGNKVIHHGAGELVHVRTPLRHPGGIGLRGQCNNTGKGRGAYTEPSTHNLTLPTPKSIVI